MAKNALMRVPAAKKLLKMYQSKQTTLQNLKDKTKKETEAFLVTGETCAGGFVLGLAHNKLGKDHEVLGVRTGLLAGGVTKILAISGMAGKKVSPHLHAIANGFLTAEAYLFGLEVEMPTTGKTPAIKGIDRQGLLPPDQD